MFRRAVLLSVVLTACPPGPALTEVGRVDVSLELVGPSTVGELVVSITGLSDEAIDAFVDQGEDWYGRAGLRIEVVLQEPDQGRVDVALVDDDVEIHKWTRGIFASQRSDTNNRPTDRDGARWRDKFLLVRYLDAEDCLGQDPCEIALPLQLDRQRGQAAAVRGQVRFGMYDNYTYTVPDELAGVDVGAGWSVDE